MNVYFAQIPITVWLPRNIIKWVLYKMIKEVLQGLWLDCAVPSFMPRWTIKRAIPKVRRESKIDTVSILSHSSLMRTDSCGTIPVSQQRLFHPAKVKWFEHFIFCDINNSNSGWQGPSYLNSWQTNHFHTKKQWKCERKKWVKRKKLNLSLLSNEFDPAAHSQKSGSPMLTPQVSLLSGTKTGTSKGQVISHSRWLVWDDINYQLKITYLSVDSRGEAGWLTHILKSNDSSKNLSLASDLVDEHRSLM